MRDGQPLAPPIDGYQAISYLGSGGFGEVFLYQDAAMGARFAIKVLRDGVAGADGTRQLMHEAQALGRLSHNGPHPNIVAVQRAGVTSGRPYIVMEYCPGGSWAQKIGNEGRIHPAKVLSVGVQIAGALYMAHRAGIVHRDIKPGNILIGARVGGQGIPKLGDFGIAALSADEVARGSAWLSRDYAAPEVLETGEADELSDVFALAATLYHALAGRSWVRVADGDNSPEAIDHRIRTSAVPEIGAHVPEALEWFVRAAMSRDREVRSATVSSAKEFAQRLHDIQLELRYDRTRVPIEEPGEHTSANPVAGPPQSVLGADTDASQWTPEERGHQSGLTATGRRQDPPSPHPASAHPASAHPASLHRASPQAALPFPHAASPHPAGVPVPSPGSRQRIAPTVRRRVKPVVWVAIAVAVLVGGGVVLANVLSGPPAAPQTGRSADPAIDDAIPGRKQVPIPLVSGTRVDSDTVKFTWTYDNAEDGDSFRLLRLDQPGSPAQPVTGPEWTLDGAGANVCVEVMVVRADRRTTERGGRACA